MEATFHQTADDFRFCPSRIPHTISVIVIALAFHTEDPDGVGYAINIFLFPSFFPSVGLEATLLTRKYNAILGGHLDFFCRHQSDDGEEKGRPHFWLVQISLSVRSLGISLCGVPKKRVKGPNNLRYVSAHRGDRKRQTVLVRSSAPEDRLLFLFPIHDTKGFQLELQ